MRAIHRLSARAVEAERRPGRHCDGAGLYLVVEPTATGGAGGARWWCFRYKRGPRGAAKLTELGLGSAATVTLAEARRQAEEARRLLREGRDPKAVKSAAGLAPTFGRVADDYIDAMAPSFANLKHLAQWRMTLGDAYCQALRARRVDEVAVADVMAVLKPIWLTKPETAQRLRGRIERVLDAARVNGLRAGDNPARWRGHLEHLLARRRTLSRGHHAAMEHADVPQLVAELRRRKSMAALAMEFLILTAARTGEVIATRPGEISGTGDGALWAVPAERSKTGREHRVPLVPRAAAILAEVGEIGGPWVFPGSIEGRHLSNMAMMQLLREMRPGMTVHGFRAAFRTWAEDCTDHPTWLAEAALGHLIGDKTEQAYRRGDALARRRALMVEWERHCLRAPAEGS